MATMKMTKKPRITWSDVKHIVEARAQLIAGIQEAIALNEITPVELFGSTISLKKPDVPRQIEVQTRAGRTVREPNPAWRKKKAAKAAKKAAAKRRPRRHFTTEQKADIAKKAEAMRAAGKEWSEIEKKLDVGDVILRRWIAEHGKQPAAKKAA